MKLVALALLASLGLAGYAHAQAPDQTPAQAPAQAPAAGHPTSKECKKEVKDLCGRRAKGELQGCIQSGLDLNKFSADCKSELAPGGAKPSS